MSEARQRARALQEFDGLSTDAQCWLAAYARPQQQIADFREALREGRIRPELVLRNLAGARAGAAAEHALDEALDQMVDMKVGKRAPRPSLRVVAFGDAS